jgi:hypothetical protein
VYTLISRLCPFCLPILLAAMLAVLAPPAADASVLELKVKASYLYKFGEFVSWPTSVFKSPDSPLNLCIAGKDPFGEILDQAVAGQEIAHRPIAIRRLEVVERSSDCHILYIAGSDRQSTAAALDAVRGANMLTVTESGDGEARGIVNFIAQDGHVHFDIDEQAATRNGLTISSKLLQLALSFRHRA